MTYIFLIYGLAFFILGFAILLYPKQNSKFELAAYVNLIAVFALLHGVNEWIDLLILINKPASVPALEISRMVALPGSFLFLLFFGVRVITLHKKAFAIFKWLPFVLIALWGIFLVVPTGSFALRLDIFSRYLFGFPGAALTAYALCLNFPQFTKTERTGAIHNIKVAAFAFFAYAIFGGIIVPKADFLPASILNYTFFHTTAGFPVQLLRAICAVVIAYSMVRVLSIFNWEAQKSLQETELRFRSIAAGAPVILFTGDNSRRITFIAGQSLQSLGLNANENIGRSVSEVFALSPQLQDACEQAIDGHESSSIITLGNLLFQSICNPLCEQDGKHTKISGFIGVLVDITQRMRTQTELDKYKDELIKVRRMASLGMMSETMAGRLDKPLTVARVFLERAMSEEPVSENLAKWLRSTWDEISRAASVITDFYTTANIVLPSKAEPLDIYQIAKNIAEVLRGSAENVWLKLLITDMDFVPSLRISQRELEQIFFIMIQNAIEAADGTQPHELRISCRQTDGRIRLTFADNCRGIAPEDISHIFEPFSGLKKQGGKDMSFELAIVKRIVTAHHGDIQVESQPGKGSTFTLTLPAD
jgi:signal transduction histidine kinase